MCSYILFRDGHHTIVQEETVINGVLKMARTYCHRIVLVVPRSAEGDYRRDSIVQSDNLSCLGSIDRQCRVLLESAGPSTRGYAHTDSFPKPGASTQLVSPLLLQMSTTKDGSSRDKSPHRLNSVHVRPRFDQKQGTRARIRKSRLEWTERSLSFSGCQVSGRILTVWSAALKGLVMNGGMNLPWEKRRK